MPPLSRLSPRANLLPSSCCTTLPCSALRIRPATPVPRPSGRHASQHRPIKAPRPAPKPIPLRSEPAPSELETQVFTSSSVQPPSFFRDKLPIYGPPDLTPAQCHEACTLYCDGTTTTKRDLAWSRRLLASHPSLTPYTLHYVGLILATNPPTHDLGLSMLTTAHELDYTPSTLQLVLLLEALHPTSSRPASFRPGPPFASAVAKHAALVRAGRDPSALALHAHLLSTKGDHRGAAEYFSRAYRAGSPLPSPSSPSPPRKPRWLLEGTTLLVHGQRLLRDGKVAEAEAVVRVAATELDQGQAYAALAQIVADPAEREGYALRAAMAGVRSACRGMAGYEEGRAAGEADEEERRVRGLVAGEWAVLGRERG